MTKFHVKGQWDSIRETEQILEYIIEEVRDKSTVRYDDDIIEFDLEIKKIIRRESQGDGVELKIQKV